MKHGRREEENGIWVFAETTSVLVFLKTKMGKRPKPNPNLVLNRYAKSKAIFGVQIPLEYMSKNAQDGSLLVWPFSHAARQHTWAHATGSTVGRPKSRPGALNGMQIRQRLLYGSGRHGEERDTADDACIF